MNFSRFGLVLSRPLLAQRRMVSPSIFTSVARFSSAGSPSRADIENRVLGLLRSFDKVDKSKVTPTAHLVEDLGIDSLDGVEVLMAVEEEFGIEINDAEAFGLTSTNAIVDYLANHPHSK